MGKTLTLDCVGRYGIPGSAGIEIALPDEGARADLVLRLPGAPRWLDVNLVRDEEERFRVTAGPLEGVPVTFPREDGRARLRIEGLGEFATHPDPAPPSYVVGSLPEIDDEQEAAFEALWTRQVEPGAGQPVRWDPSASRHAFLEWVCTRKPVVLHGSNDGTIEQFSPRRRTLATNLAGSEAGVFACTDAARAISYAILDRSRYRGAFHNDALRFSGRDETVCLYHFSINREFRDAEPAIFRPGSVYLLPRQGFRPDRTAGLAAGLEWVNRSSVEPLARLEVEPADFPLLDRVKSHDDSHVMRAGELRDRLLRECASADPLVDGYALYFERRRGLLEDLVEFAGIQQRFFPWLVVDLHLGAERGPVTLQLTGSTGLPDVLARELESARSHQR